MSGYHRCEACGHLLPALDCSAVIDVWPRGPRGTWRRMRARAAAGRRSTARSLTRIVRRAASATALAVVAVALLAAFADRW